MEPRLKSGAFGREYAAPVRKQESTPKIFGAIPLRSAFNTVPPPPPGFQYAYYDGYIVAYNPHTRMVADVLDLVAASR